MLWVSACSHCVASCSLLCHAQAPRLKSTLLVRASCAQHTRVLKALVCVCV